MLNKEEVERIKQQIFKQIDSWQVDKGKKEQAKKQIQAMSVKQLEEFLVKNKLITKTEEKPTGEGKAREGEQCVFCLISEGKIQGFQLAENKNNIAILEINPISKGHSIIIPKKHLKVEKLPSTAFTLGKKIARKIKSKLKPEKVEISTSDFQGHAIINIIPIYKEMPKERKKASESELKQLQEKLKTKPKTTRRKKVSKPKQLEKAPRRIP